MKAKLYEHMEHISTSLTALKVFPKSGACSNMKVCTAHAM